MSTRAVAQEFLIGHSTVSLIVKEVASAVVAELSSSQLPTPTTEMWLQNAEEFRQLGFPHAIGCIDGKHFACKVNIPWKLQLIFCLETS
jgi:hypothetical protein